MPRKSSGGTGKKSSARVSSRTTGSRKKSSAGARSSADRKVLIMPRRHEATSDAEKPAAKGRSASHALTDHEEIRRWAEERDAHPARVRGTGEGEDVGMIRLDFPGYSAEESLEEIEWDQWFEKFDENRLALLVQEQTAGGQRSNFNKLVKRETGQTSPSGRGRSTA